MSKAKKKNNKQEDFDDKLLDAKMKERERQLEKVQEEKEEKSKSMFDASNFKEKPGEAKPKQKEEKKNEEKIVESDIKSKNSKGTGNIKTKKKDIGKKKKNLETNEIPAELLEELECIGHNPEFSEFLGEMEFKKIDHADDSEDSDEAEGSSKKDKEKNKTTKGKEKEKEKKGKKKEKSKDDSPNKSKNSEKKNTKDENKGSWDHICLLSVILVFMLFLGFSKISEEKWSKNARYNIKLGENFVDLYEVLEIDSGASSKDIKKQYKNMALNWHPDKNPGCGKKCEDKFNEITKAYEILGNEEKRKAYDQNTGVMNIIKSSAVSLTSSNFERLVLESKDIWIIQAYENGNNYCEHIAPFWEEIVQEYSSNIKFGRINIETDKDILKLLPFNVVIVPTIFSMAQGLETEIFVLRDDVLKGLKRFVGKTLPNRLRNLQDSEAVTFFQNSSMDSNDYWLLFSSKTAKVNQYLKSLAFVHQDWLKFYTLENHIFFKVKNALKFSGEGALFFYNKTSGQKDIISFNTVLSPTFKQYKSIIDIAKFLTIPDIFRNNFREYCYYQELRNFEASSESEEKVVPHVCILFLKANNEKLKNKIEDKCRDFVEDQMPKLLVNLKGKKPLFEHYSTFQFGWIDLVFHNRFKVILKQLEERHIDDFSLNNTIAMAIFPETKKISFLDRFNAFDDWLADILESDAPQVNLLYLSDLLGDDDIPHFLHHELDSKLKFIWKAFTKNMRDLKLIATSIVLFLSLVFYRRKMNMYMYHRYTKTVMFFIAVGFHILAALVRGFMDVKEDLFS